MGILLFVVVVLALIAIAAPVWKSYESELRRSSSASSTNNSVDAMLLADAADPGPSGQTSTTHSPHHVDLTCADADHGAGCDVGGHGGFDAGHGGFDGGGHH